MNGKFADDLCFVADDNVALHQIFQFADITGPRVFDHALNSVLAESRRVLAVELAVLMQEIIEEDGDLGATFAQRRNVHGDDVQAVEQIFAKETLPDGALQRFVGGSEHTDIDGDVALAAETGEFAVLEHVQALARYVHQQTRH